MSDSRTHSPAGPSANSAAHECPDDATASPGDVRPVLLTGFDAFGGDARNPSSDAVAEVARTWSGPERLVTAVLPVAFDAAEAQLRELIAEHSPALVLGIGLAGGRTAITPERVAVNLKDARIPDNAGAQPIDEPVVAAGPAAYFSSLPVKAMAQALRAEGLPAAVSHTAGTFVCNHVFYVAAHEAHRINAQQSPGDHREDQGGWPPMRAGFLHVPWSQEAASSSDPADSPDCHHTALPATDIARAVRIAVRTALDVREDLRESSAGTLH